MVLSTTKAGALVAGRVRIKRKKEATMREIEGNIITRDTFVGGKPVEVGDVLKVGEDISIEDAISLSQIKKAVSDVEAETNDEARARAELAIKIKNNFRFYFIQLP